MRIIKAREIAVDQKLDPQDYKELKEECTKKIIKLEEQFSKPSTNNKSIDGLLSQAINNLCKLDKLYEEGTVLQKRQIIVSIFPEKLVFDGFTYRNIRLNEAVRVIYKLGAGSSEMKNRKSNKILRLSGEVVLTGIEPVSKV
jgi:site-specific DNA recombinase